MSNLSTEDLRRMMGGTTVVLGSQTVTGSAVALTDTQVYANGFLLSNSDSSSAFTVSLGTATLTPGAGNFTLGPGQSAYFPGAPHSYTVISAGSPVANWIGMP